MEEKKSKVVEMTPQENKPEQSQKLSYEQLEQAAHQLSEQVQYLYGQLQATNTKNLFARLDYLFKVIENSDKFDADFVGKCTDEIKVAMTIPDKDEDEDTDKVENSNPE